LKGKAEAPSRIQMELAAVANARDENMRRLKQLRLERDAQTLLASKQTPQAVKGAKGLRRPGTAGRG
jgi:hypothetical protein